MKNTKHTQGEWKVNKENGLIFVYNEKTDTSHCIANYDGTLPTHECLFISDIEMCEANAKLIAAAPELYDYISKRKLSYHNLIQQRELTPSENEEFELLLLLIKKATK